MDRQHDLLILGRADIESVLADRTLELIDWVRDAYLAHANHESALPHSTFLQFPDDRRNRIIALPAFLGGRFQTAGVKWIASFPDNVSHGIERASAVIVLNSVQTGRPSAILEGSVISAKRTAASAALAARCLHHPGDPVVGLIGAGRINFEIVRFLDRLWPGATAWSVFDLDPARGRAFKQQCDAELPRAGARMRTVDRLEEVLSSSSLISFATTAATPHVSDLSLCQPGVVVLHVSLRDLTPEVILASDNVVDDIDHVCRAATSIHLTEQRVSSRDFIRCEIAALLSGTAPARRDPRQPSIFSPFGLGVLDLAVAQHVTETARQAGLGATMSGFLEPASPVAS